MICLKEIRSDSSSDLFPTSRGHEPLYRSDEWLGLPIDDAFTVDCIAPQSKCMRCLKEIRKRQQAATYTLLSRDMGLYFLREWLGSQEMTRLPSMALPNKYMRDIPQRNPKR